MLIRHETAGDPRQFGQHQVHYLLQVRYNARHQRLVLFFKSRNHVNFSGKKGPER